MLTLDTLLGFLSYTISLYALAYRRGIESCKKQK